MGPSTPPEHEFMATPSTPHRDQNDDTFDVNQLRGKAQVQSPARTPRARHVLMTPGTTPRRRVLFPPTTPVRGSGRQGRKVQIMSSRASAETIAGAEAIPMMQTPARTPHQRGRGAQGLQTPMRNLMRANESENGREPQTPRAPATPHTPGAPRTPANLEQALLAAAGASPRASSTNDANTGATTAATRNDSEPAVYTSHRTARGEVPSKKGMWYVFRGKKVFRPFGRDEEPLRPVRLFAAEIDATANAHASAPAPTTDSEDDTDHEWDSPI